MNIKLEKIVELLKGDQFITISNIGEFPELSKEDKDILKNFGLPSYEFGIYPIIMSNGKLKKGDDGKVEIGHYGEHGKFYIDNANGGKIVFFDIETKEYDVVNSSLRKFLECKYTLAYYYVNVEFAKKYGDYNEKDNNLKYTKILRNMLNDIEPGIEKYETWKDYLFQKELGVI